MDYSQFPARDIAIVDMKSFYGSIECVKRNLDPLTDFLAVAGNTQRNGSVILAATKKFKEMGIKTGSRLYDIPEEFRKYVVSPNMQLYIDVSVNITRLLNQYVPIDDIFVYSIDEQFIDLTNCSSLYTPYEAITDIKQAIFNSFGLPSAWGLGDNPFLAKVALDIYAKKEPSGIAEIRYSDLPDKLWTIENPADIWGIGNRTKENLARLGIKSVYQLAHYPVEKLEKHFGVLGCEWFLHSWGIDTSVFNGLFIPYNSVDPNMGKPSKTKGYGRGQTLLRDYSILEAKTILLELCEETMRQVRLHKFVGKTVSITVNYSRDVAVDGFNRSMTVQAPFNETMKMYNIALTIYRRFVENYPIRYISVRLTNLSKDTNTFQMSLFDPNGFRKQKLGPVMDAIRQKHGSASLVRARSLTSAGTTVERSKLVGGHQANEHA